jgi:uncharacterized protein YlzI (FlbEa/FlbD family)
MDYIAVHTIDGREVLINRAAIVTVGDARKDGGQRVITDRATCVVTLVDGKFVTVVESCDTLRQRLKER